MTSGLSESLVASKLEFLENKLPENISLAYLPSPGVVKLRLTGNGTDAKDMHDKLNGFVSEIKQALGNYAYGDEVVLPEEFIGKQLQMLQATLSTAESCTGGKIAHKITSIAGASDYFKGAIISYSAETKINMLKVSPETIKQFGTVSEQTVSEMLEGAHAALNTDFVIAVTGNAGPGSDDDREPVGTIYIGVSGRGKKVVKKYFFNKNRDINIEYASMFALHELRILLTDCLA